MTADSDAQTLFSRHVQTPVCKAIQFVWLRIPTQSGRGFRFEAGHRSDLIPATIPI
jgi:hypothetical protein